jgi:hypothetical protein
MQAGSVAEALRLGLTKEGKNTEQE